jgi:hypothetical protein
LTSFPENPQLYIFAYTITDIMHILNKSASWYISFELSGLLAEEVFIAFEKADKTMVLRNARASAIITLLEEDKNVTSGIRILNLKAI